jgi:hypothetical protein
MTVVEFEVLNMNAQAEATMDGTFLADREENGLMIQLFSVSDFYVERFYDPLANKILKFRAFKGNNQLTPYLAHIRFNLH